MSIWGSFEHDPRDPATASLRASDRDRSVIADVLAQAYADGRLTRDEFDDRSEQLTASRTLGELPGLVGDLMPATPSLTRPEVPTGEDAARRAELAWRQERNSALWGFAFVATICWVIWALTGADFPWPIFPTLALGLPALRTQVSKHSIIEAKEASYRRRALREAHKAERRHHGELPRPDGD